ncbi:MAG: hypothetical protein L6Q92_10245 [Phycisphaerae bacterium]|nr:hypothetical protein [Phycisphaerae bacterium]
MSARFTALRVAAVAVAAVLFLMVQSVPAADCTQTSVGLTPLPELGAGLYLGLYEGGLYPGGSNDVPPAHAAEGLIRAAALQPLSTTGQPDANGKIVLLSIGMSNTTQEFCAPNSDIQPCTPWSFMGQAAVDPRVNHSTLVIVNGARGGQVATSWDSPTDPNYDQVRDTRLAPSGVTEAQVQAAWVKVAQAQPSVSLPAANADANTLLVAMGGIARALKGRYPNIQVAFYSSRIYAGYANNTSTLNPEPYAYESGFSVKWLVEAQIEQLAGGPVDPQAGDLALSVAPWVAWGPYIWADGINRNDDGLYYVCADLTNDGTHPSPSGQGKVGTKLLDFFLHSPFAVPWFRVPGSCIVADVNDDGRINGGDVRPFVATLLDPPGATDVERCAADVSDDDQVTLADVGPFIDRLLGL